MQWLYVFNKSRILLLYIVLYVFETEAAKGMCSLFNEGFLNNVLLSLLPCAHLKDAYEKEGHRINMFR